MKPSLKTDLKQLAGLAFHRRETGSELIRRIHRLHRGGLSEDSRAVLEQLRRWLLVPITLWPAHLQEMGQLLTQRIEKGAKLDYRTRLLLDLLGEPPDEMAVAVTVAHEHAVQPGDYGSLLHSPHKFDFMEQELVANPAFRADWERLKDHFDVSSFQDHKRIIRRRMLPERNFRNGWAFDWDGENDQFRTVFDVFCWRWNLYGMRGDEPLLMKLTVNLTPYGTMIFIPAYWSFDPKRDLKWRAITALHKARGVGRQGPKLGLNQIAQREEAERALEHWNEATAAGQKGKQRAAFVMARLGWSAATDESKLRRLLKLATAAPKKGKS